MLGAEAQTQNVTLPPQAEREWLLSQTAELLAKQGYTAYLRGPMLEPTPAYFPDRWAGGEASVRRLLLRLLRYAGHEGLSSSPRSPADAGPSREGLSSSPRSPADAGPSREGFDVVVVIHDEDPARRGEVVGKPGPMRGKEPMAWFVRRDGNVLHFACEQAILREVENLVPSLARAVAHAHRVVLGLEQADNQRLIDLTGVALGFGLLTVDASQRFYARSAGGFRSTRAEFRLGALSVQDMCFLLAMQLHARGYDRRTRRRLLGRLQPNQAAFAREAYAWLEDLDPALPIRLRLPTREHWPAAPDLDALTGPLTDPRQAASEQLVAGSGVFGVEDDDDDDEAEQAEDDDDESDDDEPRRDQDHGIRNANRGKPVFRIERSGAWRMAKLLGLPVVLLGMLFTRGEFGVDISMDKVIPLALGLAILGLIVGSFFTDRRCSEPKCGAALKVDQQVCSLCGGVVMGVIHHAKERLGAEEELARAGKVTAEGLVVGWREDA